MKRREYFEPSIFSKNEETEPKGLLNNDIVK